MTPSTTTTNGSSKGCPNLGSSLSNPCLVRVTFSPAVPQDSRPSTPQKPDTTKTGRAKFRETFLCRSSRPFLGGLASGPRPPALPDQSKGLHEAPAGLLAVVD